jgi:hypothetical protein
MGRKQEASRRAVRAMLIGPWCSASSVMPARRAPREAAYWLVYHLRPNRVIIKSPKFPKPDLHPPQRPSAHKVDAEIKDSALTNTIIPMSFPA